MEKSTIILYLYYIHIHRFIDIDIMRNAKIPGEEEAKECGNKVASSGGVVVVATSESDT